MSDSTTNDDMSDSSATAENDISYDGQNDDVQLNNAELENLQSLACDSIDSLQGSQDGPSQANVQKYVPGPLSKEGKNLEKIKQCLLDLISRSEKEQETELAISYIRPNNLINNDIQKAALLSHTMAAYVSTLNEHLAHYIGTQMVSDTGLWISRAFRFFDSSVYFNKDSRAGLIGVIRMILHARYPKYANQGYEALYTRPAVIYCSDYLSPILGHYLCTQLGLPLSCLTSVPCLGGSVEVRFKMDTAALEKCITDDIAAAKIPLLVIANAGMPLLGHVDDLPAIQEICNTHNVWLHIDGHNLAALCLAATPSLPLNLGDSMTLAIGKWIGLPSLPYVTLYRSKEMAHVHAAGLIQAFHGHPDFLPIWVTIQALGHDGLVQKIQHCFEMTERLLETIEQFPELRIISKRKLIESDVLESDGTRSVPKGNPMADLLNTLTSVIVFQYVPRTYIDDAAIKRNPPYFDNLNTWLVQILARHVPCVRSELLDLEEFGVCFRICPLETVHILGSTQEDVDQFCQAFRHQIGILNSTVVQRDKLYQDYQKNPKLQLVEIANWAGMGGIRYIPDFWTNRLNELTDTGKEDINRLNSELVSKLRASDSAFSIGEADDGMLCVRFGMVDDKLDMDELMNLVTSAGQELEESSKFLETMSEMIKQGIEAANKELVLENQEKLMQEGLLRQLPMVGSLVSWWYPAPNEAGIKGRSFNLSSGTIESTENIYKYHMQIKEGTKPPTPSAKVRVSPSPSQISPPEGTSNSTTSQNTPPPVQNEKPVN